MEAGRAGAALLALALLVVGCASEVPTAPLVSDVGGGGLYTIGPADVVSVRVWKNPELSVEEIPVRPDGRITVPLLNDIQAGGLTALALKKVIADGLSEFLAIDEADVTVLVVEVNSRRVFVLGEVEKPTVLPLTQDLRVLDAITLAGGFKLFAKKRQIKVLRRQPDGGVVELGFDYDAFVSGEAPESNIVLYPGDTIVVPD